MSNIEFLQELGLTKNESKVYLVLLESGRSLAGTIAEKAKVHRRNVYDALKRLVEKGVVTHVQKERKEYYEAITPERFVDILKEKVHTAESYLPELMAKFSKSKSKQEVQILEGIGGMKTFFNKILKAKRGKFYSIGASGKGVRDLPYFMPKYISELGKKKNKIYVLKNYDAKDFEPIEQLPNVTVRILPNKFTTPTQIFLFEDYSAITIWSETPIIILIQSQEITNGFKKYFDLMWRISK